MPRSRPATVVVAALCVLLLAGCGIQIPRDPQGTLDRVEGGVLHAGITPNGDFVQVDGEQPRGSEIDALTAFADTLDAEIDWTVGSEEALVRGLENGDLDVVAGGLTDETPWTDKAGMTRPYGEVTLDDGSTPKIVMLVPLGENAFVSRLETFLTAEAATEGVGR